MSRRFPFLRGSGCVSAAVVAALGFLLFGGLSTAVAQAPHVVRVEEDWELVVSEPFADAAAPQVTCVISPVGHLGWRHIAFELNHQSMADFVPGGMQLAVWDGESFVHSHKHSSSAVMSSGSETVRWTQVMYVTGGLLRFEVTGGTSTTWGSFGGSGSLRHTESTLLTDLDGYSPDVSVANSGVGFAGNRVSSLVLKRVRVFLSDGQQVVDETPRVVHTP